MKNQWLEIDKEGLRKPLGQKDKVFLLTEMVSNAWDEDITEVDGHMTDDTESQALLAVAARQEAQSLKQAQTAARKRLRAEAKAKRDQLIAALKQERIALRAAAKERTRRFESEMRQVNSDLRLVLLKSNDNTEQQFQQSRQTQLESGILGQAIARRDLGLGSLN